MLNLQFETEWLATISLRLILMKSRYLTTLVCFLLIMTSGTAQMQVNKFAVTSGGKALTNQVKDHNGQVCAHIRITTINLDDAQR